MPAAPRSAVLAWVAGGLGLVAAGHSVLSGQDRSQPSFPTQAEGITVDVVVLDKAGQPVTDLTRDDFTLLDGGRPQPIVAFEARRIAAGRAARDAREAGAAADAIAERVVSNVGSQRGRVLVVVVDDLGLTAPVAQQVGPALARWIREQAEPTDEITIQTTSGDIWWSAEVGSGRADLVAVLDRLRGKRALPPSTEWVSDVEAYQIAMLGSHGEAAELDSSKGDQLSITKRAEEPSPPPRMGLSDSVLDRVATRFLEAKSCYLVRSPRPAMFQCKTAATMRAEEVYGQWTRRAGALLGLVKRVSADLAPLPGRKSVLIVTDELLRDVSLEGQFRDVVTAAQRGNTAVYFSRASGLTGPGLYTAAGGGNAHPSDVATLGVEEMQVAVGGGDHLADETGGASITTSNDLAAGLDRMARDGSAYYLLGYQPQRAPDGKWHRLEVKVRREGLEVRARRGYVAQSASAAAELPLKEPAPRPARGRRPALPSLSAATRDAIPLRVASYLENPDGAGAARILMVIEVDGDHVRTEPAEGGTKARLELSVLAVSRDQPKVLPLAQTLEMKLRPRDKGWWAFFRDVRLPPGVAQLRVRVRDTVSGAQGSVAQRIEVPDVDAPYLSTPFVSDAVQPPRQSGEPPQIVPTARRTFPARGTLYCQYELFSFGGRDLPGVARVMGSYTLARSTGEVVMSAPPTLISTDGTRVVRRLALPLGSMSGAYDLVLTVEDHLANRSFTTRERFEVTREVAGTP
jgi:VWFA-related protein